jgi:hypothetical protein
VSSGTEDTAAAQQPAIQAAIQSHAAGIVIPGNDPQAVCPALKQAQAQRTADRSAADNAARYPLSALAANHYLDALNQTDQHEAAIRYLRNQQAITHTQPAYYALQPLLQQQEPDLTTA